MATFKTGSLLRFTRLLLVIVAGLSAVLAIAMTVIIPCMWLFPTHLNLYGHATREEILAIVSAFLAVLIAAACAAFIFLRQLIAVIDSVKHGSPFVPNNARRLRTMGWIVLAVQALILLAGPFVDWVKTVAPDAELDVSFSFGWFVTALLLFILASVFEHGTRLEEDVEGVV